MPKEREEEDDRQWHLRRAAEHAQWQKENDEMSAQWKKAQEEREQWLQTPEGQAWSAAQAVRKDEERVLAEAANWQRDYLLLGVISRLAPAALEGEGIDDRQAIEHAREYVRGGGMKRGESLTLLGESGDGKSFAAAAVLRAAAGAGSRKFIYFPSLIGALLDSEQRKGALAAAKETWLVVFDEIGGGYVKKDGLVAPLFEEIIFWRHGEFRPTIFTSNLTDKEFADSLSDRVIDRLREWGPVYNVTDRSLRIPYQQSKRAKEKRPPAHEESD